MVHRSTWQQNTPTHQIKQVNIRIQFWKQKKGKGREYLASIFPVSFSKAAQITAIIDTDHVDFIIKTSKKIKEERCIFKLRPAECDSKGQLAVAFVCFCFLVNCRNECFKWYYKYYYSVVHEFINNK